MAFLGRSQKSSMWGTNWNRRQSRGWWRWGREARKAMNIFIYPKNLQTGASLGPWGTSDHPRPFNLWASPCPCPLASPSALTPHSQPQQRFLFALILKSPKFSPVSDTNDNFEPITTAKCITLYSDTVSPLHRNLQVVNFPRSECVFCV